jgi:hypothetical protein
MTKHSLEIMDAASVSYDHINKRLVAVAGEETISIPVVVSGTKHASLSRGDVERKAAGRVDLDAFVRALKRYRNANGKSFIVTVAP